MSRSRRRMRRRGLRKKFRGRGGGGKDSAGQNEQQNIDIETQPKEFFVGVVSTAEHLKAQEQNRPRYVAALAVLQKYGVAITQNSRVRALAMAWGRQDYELADALLKNRNEFGLPEVLKAVQLLDSGRQIRVLEKKLKRLQLSRTTANPKKIRKLKSNIDNLTALKPPVGSASGAVCKQVARSLQGFTREELEFYALHLPKEPWKKLADICHFHPEKGFTALPWFLPFCFGADAPEGTMVERCSELNQDNVNNLVMEFNIPYSHIRQLKDSLSGNAKKRIAQYEEKLDTVLWYYEDLECMVVDEVIKCRLAAKEAVTLPNGKLLERLLTIKMIRDKAQDRASFLPSLINLAEPRLTSIKLSLEAPIVVLGDKSSSMEVAVRTSTIIAALLTAITTAKLVFFNSENHKSPFMPKTVKQVLQLAMTIKAGGGTTPAASLWPFYKRKKVVKTFMLVTDEQENGKKRRYWFAELYKKYYEEVYPARLVFVSFLKPQHAPGEMVTALNKLGYNPLQFRLDGSRPDLSKLDTLFGLLSSDSDAFKEEVAATEKRIREEGLALVYDALKQQLKGEKKE